MNRSTAEIRQTFLDFFKGKEHRIIPSSTLIPSDDPTLLFTNAGMNQFKNVFLGFDKRYYTRAATSQRCMRAGGKHNDLENVGYTTKHHTFFEMLGNFSFGDYFKYEAIHYAWELLTSEKWFNLSKERLWITIYKNDDESYKIWKEIGIPHERIIRIGDKKEIPYMSDNFWEIGDTGPCGPCTEIFYDYGDHIHGSPPGKFEGTGDRYIEIWNIVFMQFNRQIDNTMDLLPKPSVDTGMGLERIAAVLQNVNSNYEIDLFRKLILLIAQIIGVTDLNNKSLLVIADHIRSCAFLIADGIIPSNENRGYVLRRIIRRAIRHGNKLGVKEVFFYKLVEPLIEVMTSVSEDLKYKKSQIEKTLRIEEEQFIHTLKRGISLLNKELANLSNNTLDGEIAFRLYDTYGFPIDLTSDICRESNIHLDKVGFKIAMKEQQCRSYKSSRFNSNYDLNVKYISEFYGYNCTEMSSKVVSLLIDGKLIDSLSLNQKAIVVLDKTPFYAESGGQIGDCGELKGNNFIFKVNDTQKCGQTIGHIGELISGFLKIGDIVQADVNKVHRAHVCLNHSATHLVKAALQKVLGTHIVQKGSLIKDKMLRFDFSYPKAIKKTEIFAIENLVNTQIRNNLLIEANFMDLKSAIAKGAVALLNKKYNERVRVINIGDFSIELCGGTHVYRTGDIGLFIITSEFRIAAGTHRIEAITGEIAIDNLHQQSNQMHDIMQLLKINNIQRISEKVKIKLEYICKLEKKLNQLEKQIAIQKVLNLSNKAKEIKGVKLIVSELVDIEQKMLHCIVNDLKNRLNSVIVVLAVVIKGKILLTAGVSENITNRIRAGELINMIAQQVGGKGDKKFLDIARAVGTNVTALSTALNSVEEWVNTRL